MLGLSNRWHRAAASRVRDFGEAKHTLVKPVVMPAIFRS